MPSFLKNKLVYILLGVIVLSVVLILVLKPKGDNKPNVPNDPVPPVVKKLKIVDEDSKTRPVAVMINNIHVAWPHAGLQDAYIVYEIIVEGGITRLMALFKDKDTAKIGSVRSARHYYLDYALENDAIYTHFGWSPQAQSDISSLGINNVNGLYDGAFWRDYSIKKPIEHIAFTSMEKINATIKNKGYRTETNKDLLLNYSVDEIDITDGLVANNVSINYSTYHTTSYVYDSVNKVYLRSMKNQPHVDAITSQQYTAKNIIVCQMNATSMDSTGRQNLDNIGTKKGYYITNGFAKEITCEKTSRSGQTVYKYLDGSEIKVNDGNTFIQIQPLNKNLTIN